MRRISPRTFAPLLAAALLSPLWSGCGESTPTNPSTVHGTVTYNGETVDGATVSFRKEGGGYSAFGRTDDNGVFTLQDSTGATGAQPGDYVVTVKKIEFADGNSVSEDDPNYDESTAEEKPVFLVPEKYSQPKTTDLKATLVEGDNVVPLQLTD